MKTPLLSFPLGLGLLLGLGSTAFAEEAWVRWVQEGTRAFARMDVPGGQEGYCKALTEASFGEDDPRYPILLYNRSTAFTCCGDTGVEACGSGDARVRGAEDLIRAGKLVEKFGVDTVPDYAVIVWHVHLAELQRCRSQDLGPGVDSGCPDPGITDEVVRVLVAAAPSFSQEVSWTPGSPGAGVRVESNPVPSSWMVQARQGKTWPRAMVMSDFMDPPLVARRVFPAVALEILAKRLVDVGVGESSQVVAIFEQSAALVEAALGREHPRTVRAWYDFGRNVKKLAPELAARRLSSLVESLAESLGDRDHPDLTTFLLALAKVQELAGQGALVPRTYAWASRAAIRPDTESAYSRRLRVDLAGTQNRPGVPLGDAARARYWEDAADRLGPALSAWDALNRAFELHLAGGEVHRALSVATRMGRSSQGPRSIPILERALGLIPAKAGKYRSVREARDVLEGLKGSK